MIDSVTNKLETIYFIENKPFWRPFQYPLVVIRISSYVYRSLKNNDEEFDPGSGWTLAAGLTHASRGVT